MSKLKIGDHVRVSNHDSNGELLGKVGQVVPAGVFQFEDEVTIRFPQPLGVYYLRPCNLELVHYKTAPHPADPSGHEVVGGYSVSTPTETPLPTDAEARKNIPLVTGLLDYFPAALAAVAAVSKAGNDKHNPGEPLHWARGKSMDQADCIGRHLLERGGIDPETGQRHSAQMAWRALALLQLELEEDGAPRARGAQLTNTSEPGSTRGHDKGTRCPNSRCNGGWVERGDNESGGAPAFPCRHPECPHAKGAQCAKKGCPRTATPGYLLCAVCAAA